VNRLFRIDPPRSFPRISHIFPDQKTGRTSEFVAKGERFDLLAGRQKLIDLREAIRGIPDGNGDFALGADKSSGDETCLWIWWMPKARIGRITSP
jgi:hypothetical protein